MSTESQLAAALAQLNLTHRKRSVMNSYRRLKGGAMRLPNGQVAPNTHGPAPSLGRPLPHRPPILAGDSNTNAGAMWGSFSNTVGTTQGSHPGVVARGGPAGGKPYVRHVLTRGGHVGDTNTGSVLGDTNRSNTILAALKKGQRNREFGGNPGEIPRHPGSIRPYQRDTIGTQQRSYNANLTPGGSPSISNVQSNTQSSRGNRNVSEVERRTMYVNGKRLDVPDIGPVGRRLRRMALKNIDASASRSEDINRLVRGNIRRSRNRNRVR